MQSYQLTYAATDCVIYLSLEKNFSLFVSDLLIFHLLKKVVYSLV